MAAASHQKRAQLIEGAAVRSCFTWDGKPETPPIINQPASYPPNVNVFSHSEQEIQEQANRELKMRSSGVKVFYPQANHVLSGETGTRADFEAGKEQASSAGSPKRRGPKKQCSGMWKWQQRETKLTLKTARRTAQARTVRDRVKARQESAKDRQLQIRNEIAKATAAGMSEVLYGFEPSCRESPPSQKTNKAKKAHFALPTTSSKSHREKEVPFTTSTYGGLILKPPPPAPKLDEAYNQKPYFYPYDPVRPKIAAEPFGKPCWIGRNPPPLERALQKEVQRVRRELALASGPTQPSVPKPAQPSEANPGGRPLSARVKRKIQEISEKFLPEVSTSESGKLAHPVKVQPPPGKPRPQTAPNIRS